jgi:apolipoprotein N-acyltransferase
MTAAPRFVLRLLAALASGLGMALLFPPFRAGDLVWVVFIPLLVALWSLGPRRRKRAAGLLGFLTGVAFFLPNLAWLRTVSDVGWIMLSLYLAVFPALWAVFAATLGNPWRGPEPLPDDGPIVRMPLPEQGGGRWAVSLRSLRFAFACAAVWTGLDWLRGWLFTGFGWNTLGVAFHETPVIAQAADLLGATGLSILPIFLQGVIVQAGRRLARGARSGSLRTHYDFGLAALLVAVVTSYGIWRISTQGQGESIRLRALLVQLNIPQEASRQLWSPEEIHVGYEDETLAGLQAVEDADQRRLQAALEKGDEGGIELTTPDWIVWPETALNGRIFRTAGGEWGTTMENEVTIGRVREAGDFTLVTGVNEVESELTEQGILMMPDARVWNTLAVLPPDGPLELFRKRHLVIFGEYIPFVERLPFLAKIYEQQAGVPYQGAFSAGDSLEPLPAAVRGEAFGIIPSVCFEDTVPRLLRKFVRGGPQIIVNVTNDGWFKESPGALQHFANARFRAIELRRPMLRCANQGVTAAINAAGLTLGPDDGRRQELRDANGSPFTRGHLLAEIDIPKNPPLTLYAVIGDWGVIVLALTGFLLSLRGRGLGSSGG